MAVPRRVYRRWLPGHGVVIRDGRKLYECSLARSEVIGREVVVEDVARRVIPSAGLAIWG